MAANAPDTLVSVYTSSSPFEADVVKAMLAEEEIPSTVQNENGPFPGLAGFPCKVYVASSHEALARQLIEVHEVQHRQRLANAESKEERAAAEDFGVEESEFEETDE